MTKQWLVSSWHLLLKPFSSTARCQRLYQEYHGDKVSIRSTRIPRSFVRTTSKGSTLSVP